MEEAKKKNKILFNYFHGLDFLFFENLPLCKVALLYRRVKKLGDSLVIL